jgi:hypothetical protein
MLFTPLVKGGEAVPECGWSDQIAGKIAMDNRADILLIHLGGLGDVCLSESTFLSLSQHFGRPMRAVGNRRILALFDDYFIRVDSIENREWASLFYGPLQSKRWRTAILIGKDRQGLLRERLGRMAEETIFIDMFPDSRHLAVEDHQLGQLPRFGIRPLKRDFVWKPADRLIIYPEKERLKKKWPVESFLKTYEKAVRSGMNAVLLRPPGLGAARFHGLVIEELDDVMRFFSEGGLFFSNDSGLAHLAARCGLLPVTLFADTDPAIWKPKGATVVQWHRSTPSIGEVADLLSDLYARRRT